MADFERSYQTLDDLDNVTEDRQIIVRLIRQWEARNPRRSNQLMSLDLLLLDEKDILIKASINHRLIGKFKQVLQEGRIFHIRAFDIGKSSERYKLTDHKDNIYFTHLTTVREVMNDAPVIAKTKFRFQDYENLLKIANTNEELPDVIGKIVSILGSHLRDTGSKQKVMANLLLKDGVKVRLSVWDNIAADFRTFLSATNRKKSVVVITSVNPKMFSGELYLNTSSATKFHINEDLEEVKNFFSKQKMENPESPLGERELEPVSFRLTTISQILSFLDKEEPQEKSFYCKATIVGIETQNGWNYISCSKCFKKLIKDERSLICPQCEATDVIGIIRFRLEVMVDDDTDRGTFIIFDKDGRNLTNTLAAELISVDGPSDDKQEALPVCIQELIGRKYVFEVNVKPFDFKARYKTFTVSRIVNECFEDVHTAKRKEESRCNKDVVKNNKHTLKKMKKEDESFTVEEKKSNNSRGKRMKHNS